MSEVDFTNTKLILESSNPIILNENNIFFNFENLESDIRITLEIDLDKIKDIF